MDKNGTPSEVLPVLSKDAHKMLLNWSDVLSDFHNFKDIGGQAQTILAFVEGSISLAMSCFVILSIVFFRRNFRKQIRLYFNMVVACFAAGLYIVCSRTVNLIFHYQKHPEDTVELDVETELVHFPPCQCLVYFWMVSRDMIFLSTVPITLDRFIAVMKPRSYRRLATNRFFTGMILLTWTVTALHVCTIALLADSNGHRIYLSQHTLGCVFGHHEFSAHVSLVVYLGIGMPTLFIHIVGYLVMFFRLSGRIHLAKSSRELLKVGIRVAIAFSITWLPQVIIKTVNHVQSERNKAVHQRLPTAFEFCCFFLSNSSPILNCVIYIFAVKNIRTTIFKGYSREFRRASTTLTELHQRLSRVGSMSLRRERSKGDIGSLRRERSKGDSLRSKGSLIGGNSQTTELGTLVYKPVKKCDCKLKCVSEKTEDNMHTIAENGECLAEVVFGEGGAELEASVGNGELEASVGNGELENSDAGEDSEVL